MNTQDTVHRKSAAELRIRRVMDALEKNNMQAYYAPTCAEAVKIAKELLQPGDVISCGGSVTLDETGVMDLMRCGDYEFLDRTAAKTPEEREKPEIINARRRERIAKGSGTTVADVNRLMKQFEETRKMMKMVAGGNMKMPKMPRGFRR